MAMNEVGIRVRSAREKIVPIAGGKHLSLEGLANKISEIPGAPEISWQQIRFLEVGARVDLPVWFPYLTRALKLDLNSMVYVFFFGEAK